MNDMSVHKLRFKADDGNDFPEWKEKEFLDCISKVVDFRGRTPLKLETKPPCPHTWHHHK